jgi:hypothetical protein
MKFTIIDSLITVRINFMGHKITSFVAVLVMACLEQITRKVTISMENLLK